MVRPTRKPDMVEALKEMEQSQLAEVLHDIIMSGGGCFKIHDIVHLLKNISGIFSASTDLAIVIWLGVVEDFYK